ncbi:MAG TPA: ABC transporter permease, partial [Gemmatimonadaceae bacterium]|nr:ABC transporter permease [Gemmatimonadaceae bacterium]
MALASPRPLLDDLRYAARSLAHSRGYALATVLLLALGVGANTAMFSLVDAVLFRRLAVERSEELLRVYASGAGSERGALSEISYPAYADFRDQATAFAGLAGYRDNVPLHLAAAGAAPERVEGAVVTGNYFGVLGVRPRVGRLLAPDDDRAPGAHPVAVLSERLWRARFAARPNVAGTVVRLNAVPFTVVGVAPAGFRGVSVEQAPDVWVSTAMVDDALPDLRELKPLERRGFRWLHVVGRL